MQPTEPLDYCRVKKIFDKGFGFLSSLHYENNVFFHFSMVKDPTAKEKLEKMKRGDIYFFYTSKLHKEKRRVKKLWLDLSDVDKNLIPDFTERIIKEFILGKTNPYEVAFVIKELRKNGFVNPEQMRKLLSSNRISTNPSIIKAFLTDNENDQVDKAEELINKLESSKISKDRWIEGVISIL